MGAGIASASVLWQENRRLSLNLRRAASRFGSYKEKARELGLVFHAKAGSRTTPFSTGIREKEKNFRRAGREG